MKICIQNYSSQAWWHRPINLATQDVGTGSSQIQVYLDYEQVQGLPGQLREKYCLKIKRKRLERQHSRQVLSVQA